jgi:S1-C subfamily serine protease
MRMALRGLLGLAVALSLVPSSVNGQSARVIAQKTFPSVVLIVMQDANGQAVSLGSGFFVRDGILATNLHVIEGAARGYAKLVGQETKYAIDGIAAVDGPRDLDLLAATGARAPSLSLGDTSQVAVGDEVYVVGNPQGLEGTFSQGIVSGIRQVGSDNLLQITAPISPGSSGGPVLNGNGEVVGVAVATFKVGQNLNFAIPASYLKSLLSNGLHVKPLALSTRTSGVKAKSILSNIGGRSVSGVSGTHFAWGDLGPGGWFFTFSLLNQLAKPIEKVRYLVIFYDRFGKPVDSYAPRDVDIDVGVIPAGLAKRVVGRIEESVRPLTARVEIRVLDFRIPE